MPRILAINANTSQSITDLVAVHLRAALGPEVELDAVTGRFGARYIATEAANAVAGHAALDAWAEHGAGCDAVLLACFGDPGLFALREIAPVPVVGLAEASMRVAGRSAERFSLVTGGRRWPPMLERLAASLGYGDRIASIRHIELTGVEIAANPAAALDRLAAECRAARREDGAEAVILGGAGLAGLAVKIEAAVGAPLIDSVIAGAGEARALALGAPWPYRREAAGDVTPSIGLADALARRLRD